MNEELLRERIEDLCDDKLLALYHECYKWGGEFDFTDTWNIKELCNRGDTYQIVMSVIYGDVRNIVDNVRYNAYGNLETVTKYDLYNECRYHIDELIEWIIENGYHIDLDYYIETDDLYLREVLEDEEARG